MFASIYIFPHFTYRMKDELNSRIAFPQSLKQYFSNMTSKGLVTNREFGRQ